MEWVSGNILIRPQAIRKAGDVVPGHAHNFDHTTIVFKGAVRIKAKLPDGRVFDQAFTAPAHALIKAGVEHEITALVEGTECWCIYSHRTPQGDVVQDYNGWADSYV